jgi:hypothetical protein
MFSFVLVFAGKYSPFLPWHEVGRYSHWFHIQAEHSNVVTFDIHMIVKVCEPLLNIISIEPISSKLVLLKTMLVAVYPFIFMDEHLNGLLTAVP